MSILAALPGPVALICGVGERNAPAQAGMLAAITQDGWSPDFVVGSSAGALTAAAAIAAPDRAAEVAAGLWLAVANSALIDPGWTRFASALTGGEPARINRQWRKLLTEHLGEASLGDPASDTSSSASSADGAEGAAVGVRGDALVAMELPSGEPRILDSGSLVDATLTSAAFPVIVNPITEGNHLLLDGGFAAPVPVLQAAVRGAASAVVLHTGRPAWQSEAAAPSRWYDVVLSSVRAQVGAKASHDIAEAARRIPIVILDTAKPAELHWSDAEERIATGNADASAQLQQLDADFAADSSLAPGVYAVAPEITGDLRLAGVLRQPGS